MSTSRSPSEPPAPRRERNAVETKRRLLDAAEAEFAAKGFAGARLRDVAATAGVQQALIHHYFVDKDGLYRAVLERAVEQTAADSWQILGQVNGFVPLVEAFVDLLVRFYGSHANLLAMLRLEASSGSTVLLNVLQERTKPVFEAAEALLRRYQQEGVVRADIPPAQIIIGVMSMVFFPLQEGPFVEALWPSGLSGTPEERQAAHKKAVIAIALRGVLA